MLTTISGFRSILVDDVLYDRSNRRERHGQKAAHHTRAHATLKHTYREAEAEQEKHCSQRESHVAMRERKRVEI